MKKSILNISAGLLLAAVFTGCSWKVPQKVSVKTKAEYNLSLGKFETSLGDYIGLEKIKSLIPDASGMHVYEYNPGGKSDCKQFLVKKNIATVPVDLSQYMGELTQDIEPISQKLSIPEIKYTKSQEIGSANFSNALSDMVKFAGPFTAEAKVSGAGDAGTSFDYFQYESGKMTVYLDDKATAGTNPKVVLKNGSVEKEAPFVSLGSTLKKEIDVGLANKIEVTLKYKAEVDISDFKVYQNNMIFSFEDVSGAVYFCGEVEPGSKIKTASGVNISNYEISVDPMTISGALDGGIKALTVGEGFIDSKVVLPAEWSNVSINLSYIATGGLDLSGSGKTSLNGKAIGPTDISFTPKVKLTVKNGTIDFTKSPSVDMGFEVSKIATVTIDTASLGGFSSLFEITPVELPKEITDVVTTVWFGASEFTVKSKNTMPAGNDISVTCNSALLKLTDGQFIIPSGGSEYSDKMIATAEDLAGSGTATDSAKVDFSAAVTLPGANGTEATFKNLEPGKEYEISIAVTPEIKWQQMSLNLSKFGGSESKVADSIDTGIKFSDLTGNLGESGAILSNMKFTSLPVYLYCNVPDMSIFNSIKFNGKVKITTSSDKYLLGNESGEEDLPTAPVPVLETDSNGVVVTDLNAKNSSIKADLSDVISFSEEQSLKLYYDLAITGATGTNLTVKPEDVGQKGSLEISAFIALPVSLEVLTESEIDLMKVLNKTGDLLGREEGFEPASYTQYLALVDDASVILNTKLPLGVTPEDNSKGLVIKVDLYSQSTDPEKPEPMVINLDSPKLTMTGDDIEYLFGHLTSPSVKVVVPKGNLYLGKDLNLSANIGVQLRTDGKVPVLEL